MAATGARAPFTNEDVASAIASDPRQGRGLGTRLLTRLIEIARKKTVTRLNGAVLADNRSIRDLCSRLGFTLDSSEDRTEYQASLELTRRPAAMATLSRAYA